MDKNRPHPMTTISPNTLIVIGVAAMVVALIISVRYGSISTSTQDLLQLVDKLLHRGPIESETERILYQIRIPRALTASVVGMLLSLAGLIMQSLFQNPLADSSTLGISSGASLGAVTLMLCGNIYSLSGLSTQMIGASLGAIGSLILLFILAYLIDRSIPQQTLILIGIIMTLLFSSAYYLILLFAKERATQILFWSFGSLGSANYTKYIIGLITLIICSLITYWHHTELDLLAIDEQAAYHLGVSVRRTRVFLALIGGILVGCAVAIAGNIAFVGLIIPHIARRLVGPLHRHLIPLTLLCGGTYLTFTDLLSRIPLSPVEMPIGLLTSLIGSLGFLFILLRERRS